jgi:hypothetical protein
MVWWRGVVWCGCVVAAMDRARQLACAEMLHKVPWPANKGPVLCLPYDPRLPPISSILAWRHWALLANDADAREYLASLPMVTYTRTKNLCNLVFRARVPALHRPLR